MTNPFLILIITFLFGVYLLDTLADALNLTRLRGELPAEFKGIYDPQKYEQSLKYQRENIYFEFIHRTFFFILTLCFILLGGFNTIDLFARSFGWSLIPTGLVFVGSLSVLMSIVNLPFSLYET